MKKSAFIFIILGIFLVSFASFMVTSVSENSNLNKIEEGLLEEFENSNEVRVIVNIRDDNGNIPETEREVNQVLELVDNNGVQDYIPEAIVGFFTEEEVLELEKNENVFFIEKVKYAKPILYDSVEITGAVDVWERDIDGVPLTGQGQSICIVDTGVDFSHPDLADKNILGCNLECPDDFSGDCPMNCDATDTDGHGTHMAGVAAASGDINGIAKGADIISLKVIPDGEDGASELRILNALVWCWNNREEYNIVVISMSLGDETAHDSYCNGGFVGQAINEELNPVGLATVIATGNGGSDEGISWPACIEKAIPVGATDKEDNLWVGSNYNWMVKLFAPGVDITSTQSGGGYFSGTGTSPSTPMVAASVAMIRQATDLLEMDPLNPKDEIEPLLFDGSEEIVGLDFDQWRRININLAMNELIGEEPVMCPADLDGDGNVGTGDLIILLGAWGENPGHVADIDGDGNVGTGDLILLLGGWGPCPEGVNGSGSSNGDGAQEANLPPGVNKILRDNLDRNDYREVVSEL